MRQRLRPLVLDSRVYRRGDIDSDHGLVIVSLQLKLKRRASQANVLMWNSSSRKRDEGNTLRPSNSSLTTGRDMET